LRPFLFLPVSRSQRQRRPERPRRNRSRRFPRPRAPVERRAVRVLSLGKESPSLTRQTFERTPRLTFSSSKAALFALFFLFLAFERFKPRFSHFSRSLCYQK
jgi:hypothetical protein